MTKEQLREVNKSLGEIGLENVQNIVLIKNGATNGDIIKGLYLGHVKYIGFPSVWLSEVLR